MSISNSSLFSLPSLLLSFLSLLILTNGRITLHASSLFFEQVSSHICMPIYRCGLKGLWRCVVIFYCYYSFLMTFWLSCINDHHDFMVTMPLCCYLLVFCLSSDRHIGLCFFFFYQDLTSSLDWHIYLFNFFDFVKLLC